jgi:NMD protein affecting ribosome stability and mRNA decay
MKPTDRANPATRHLPRLADRIRDPYRAALKPAQPATCRDCGAVFHRGHWSWGRQPAEAHVLRCPACLRIRDHYPAGYLSLKGEFALANRAELMAFVRERGEREKNEHPLERLMGVDETADGLLVTTTGTHLARVLVQALKSAYEGRQWMRYNRDENRVRITWRK